MFLTKADWDAMMPSIAIALLAYLIRILFGRRKIPLLEALIDGIAAAAAGAFVSSIVTIHDFPNAAKIGMSGLAGLIGPDLLAGLLTITKAFKDSPSEFLLKFIYAVRGVKNGMDIPSSPQEPTDHKEK